MVIRYADWYRWPYQHDEQLGEGAPGDPAEDQWGVGYPSEPTRRVDSGLDYTETWWWVPGPHTGHGPIGCERAGSRVAQEVNDRLTQHGWIDARDILVEVKDGEVTLRGSVPDAHTRRLAKDVVETVVGVADVHNELTIHRPDVEAGPGWQAAPGSVPGPNS